MISSRQGYMLEQGEYGLRAVLTLDWNLDTERSLLKQPISELELNRAKGWRGHDLSFVSQFPELMAIKIIGKTAESLSPIHTLHNLRALDVMTYCKSELRFNEFPNLIKCSLEWRPKATSLFDCISLNTLLLKGYRGSDTEPFAKLKNLESLTILGSGIQSLEGLGSLVKLRSLRLGDMRKLPSLRGIENLVLLEKLEIDTCRKIHSVEEISRLARLRELYLDNMADLESLKPLAGLSQLRRLTFVGSTNIRDGDLSLLLRLANLELVAFQDRPQYSHRRQDFANETSARA